MKRVIEFLSSLVVLVAGGAIAQPVGPQGNLPLPPQEILRRLQEEELTITSVKGAGAGVMGARKLTLVFPRDNVTVLAKWKTAPRAGEAWNNSPRREVAAYAVQQLFLDPDDYLVPPSASRCVSFDTWRVVDEHPSATLDGTRCVLGLLSAWLDNVTVPDPVFDHERFSKEPRYAFHFANLNVLTYLIAHRDARADNFLISKDPQNPQQFSIDNGISWGGTLFNFFTWHFDTIRVGGLPRKTVDRLRRVTRADLDKFAVLEELQADTSGMLRHVPPGKNLDASSGTRLAPGKIQFGLTTMEIDGLAERLNALLKRIDEGGLVVF